MLPTGLAVSSPSFLHCNRPRPVHASAGSPLLVATLIRAHNLATAFRPPRNPPSPFQSSCIELAPSNRQWERERHMQDFQTFSDLCGVIGFSMLNALFLHTGLRCPSRHVAAQLNHLNALASNPESAIAGRFLEEAIARVGSKPGLEAMAQYIHSHPDPRRRTMVNVYSMQPMTTEGIATLLACREHGTPLKAGRFLQCEKNMETPTDIPVEGKRRIQLLITAFSNKQLRPRFGQGASPTVISPRALFRINNIDFDARHGMIAVHLTEIASAQNAIDLPDSEEALPVAIRRTEMPRPARAESVFI